VRSSDPIAKAIGSRATQSHVDSIKCFRESKL
jgi:hypothetical protein